MFFSFRVGFFIFFQLVCNTWSHDHATLFPFRHFGVRLYGGRAIDATLFPTIGSNRASGKSTSRRPARSKQTIKSTKGRPPKTLVYKDLVLIPSPKINKVPTHTTRLQLEERELVCHEFPFDKSWDAHSLKAAILNRFPKLLLFEYVKVGNFALWYKFKHCSTFNALIISLLFSLYIFCGCTIFKYAFILFCQKFNHIRGYLQWRE